MIELLPPEPAAGFAKAPAELTGNLPALPQLAELQPPAFPDPEPPAVEPPPPEPEPELPPEPVAAEAAVAPIEAVAAPRPRARPPTLRRIVEPRETPQEPRPQRERQQQQPRQTQAAASAAPPARDQAAAAAAGNAGQAARVSGRAMQSWESKVRQATARHMSRARVTARGQLSATVLVRIDVGGSVQASLAQGSGDAAVDAALMRHAQRLPRMPAPPDRQPKTVVAPFRITR